MPIGYLDVPTGADLATKRELVTAMYDAMHEVYPFPDDTRIFLREWPLDSVSQNGQLGSEPPRPVFTVHVPQGGDTNAKRVMLERINQAVATTYGFSAARPGTVDGYFMIFLHEHSLSTVAADGVLLADDLQRVEEQEAVYSSPGPD